MMSFHNAKIPVSEQQRGREFRPGVLSEIQHRPGDLMRPVLSELPYFRTTLSFQRQDTRRR